MRVHLQTGATNQSEESETMSPAMDLMNQMGVQAMLSAFSNAAGLPIHTVYVIYIILCWCEKYGIHIAVWQSFQIHVYLHFA